MALSIIFMGTPDFAVPALKALLQSKHKVIAVYSQPPRPAGRGMAVKKSPVHLLADEHGVPVHTPVNFKDAADQKTFRDLKADIAVVAAYGLLLPLAILEAPKLGCINIHASLLPRWRGAAPIQYAILNGDKKSGISIMQMEKGLDTGPVLRAQGFDLAGNETAASLHNKLAALAGGVITGVLDDLEAGRLTPTPQDDGKASHAPKIKKHDGLIDWTRPAIEVDRKVRALNPYPGAYFHLGGKRIRVLDGVIEEGAGAPGRVLDGRLLIACGDKAYRVLRLQKEGKNALGAEAFLRGQPISPGMVLT